MTRDSLGRATAEFEVLLPASRGADDGARRQSPKSDPALTAIVKAIEASMLGNEKGLKRIATPDGSPFHHKCWEACRSIPRGETRTYAWLAAAAGSPKAIRAAGQAMRRNPLPIVVPCHRVVATTGIGGFAGDASPDCERVSLKMQLLALERSKAKRPRRTQGAPKVR